MRRALIVKYKLYLWGRRKIFFRSIFLRLWISELLDFYKLQGKMLLCSQRTIGVGLATDYIAIYSVWFALKCALLVLYNYTHAKRFRHQSSLIERSQLLHCAPSPFTTARRQLRSKHQHSTACGWISPDSESRCRRALDRRHDRTGQAQPECGVPASLLR